MAEAIVSLVIERVGSIIEQQIREEVNLLRGVDKKIVSLAEELKTIRYVLDDAEKKGSTGTGDKAIRHWLKKLENASYEMDDVLDEWYTALRMFQIQEEQKRKVCNYSSFISIPSCFQKVAVRHDIAEKIENVKEKIDSILAEKDRFGLVPTATPHSSTNDWRVQSTSFVDLTEIYGRDNERDDLVRRLISAMTQADDQRNHPQILSVVGVGGLGKTTLAQLVYNDTQVTECFELRIWICVSNPFDEVRIAQAIIKSVTKISPDSNELEFLLQSLKECVLGKKFLLVMDDVWTEDFSKWEPMLTSLKNGSIGSKVLVTTRNSRVAEMMGSLEDGIHRLGALSDENCWLLLQRIALLRRDEGEWEKFEGVGRNIANKCRGLPLAAKVLGSILRFKNSLEEWEDVYNSEIWKLEKAQVELFPHLLLSYNELSSTLKHCFSYCAVFPKDAVINVDRLIEQWIAVGYLSSDGSGAGDMELRGREYFDILAVRSLFQDFEKDEIDGQIWCFKMHDIVHDFAQLMRKNGDGEAGIMKSGCKTCNPSLASHAKEYRSIYLGHENPHLHWCRCLANLRVMNLRNQIQDSSRLARSILGFLKLGISREIERFIHLRWLGLSNNNLNGKDMEIVCRLYNLQTLLLRGCNLKEITKEIGNLIHLRHLDLSDNSSLNELPDSICNLNELQKLSINFCEGIFRLPQGFDRLVNLKHLHNFDTTSLKQFPQRVAHLTGLCTLTEIRAGSGKGKLEWLKMLNRLSGSLRLFVDFSGSKINMVEDARKGELRKKDRIKDLSIWFNVESSGVDKEEDREWVSLLEALEPHPNLVKLIIFSYGGSKLPSWMVSALNQLKSIRLYRFSELSSLPPLGSLPCLEEIKIEKFSKLQVVGPEFLGTTTQGSSNGSCIAFPMLKKLSFWHCDNWREWEDITTTTTTQEEEAVTADSSISSSVMPCLKELNIFNCNSLTALPHRLLASSSLLEELDITGSTQLETCYRDAEGSAWKSISDVCPHLRLVIRESERA